MSAPSTIDAEYEEHYVAAYIRVSTRAQNHATQRDAIERAAKSRGEKIDRWFAEKQSAKKLERPVLTEIRDLSRQGYVRKLYVFRLDRLARSGIRDMLMVLEELESHGTKIISVADGIDLEGPARDVVVSVLAWAGQWEHRAHGERVSAARARVEAKGGHWGRPRSTTEKQAQEIFERKKKGQSIRLISIAMKIPRSTVGAIALSNNRPSKPRAATITRTRRKHARRKAEPSPS